MLNYSSRKSNRKKLFFLFIFMTLLISAAFVLALSAFHYIHVSGGGWQGFEQINRLNKLPVDDNGIASIDEEKAAEFIEANKKKEEASNIPTIDVGKTDEDPEKGEMRDHILKETATVGEDYFADTLFIGDSRLLGLSMTWKDTDATFYAAVGLSINQLNTKKVIKEDAETSYTVMEAIERDQRDYKRIYLMFGLNELGWGYPSVFIRSVRSVIEQLGELCPNAEVCIMAIMPISSEKTVSNYKGPLANERIREFNSLLLSLAAELNIWYLDTYTLMADEEGNLPENYAGDGIHLYSEHNKKIISYITNHAFAY